jgi:hypothetical protein
MSLKITLRLVCVALGLSLVYAPATLAQGLLADQMGNPVFEKRYTNIKGSPYLQPDWAAGSVKLRSGKTFDGMKLKYDQVEDELLFLSDGGKEMTFSEPVAEFTIGDKAFRRGYPAADGAPANAFYEVITEGKMALLKRTSKKVIEEPAYNAATSVKSIRTNENYYLTATNLELTKIKKDKKSVLAALPDKKAELEDYIKDQRLDLRQEQDIVKLISYYNTL